jgi:hypothetical protein
VLLVRTDATRPLSILHAQVLDRGLPDGRHRRRRPQSAVPLPRCPRAQWALERREPGAAQQLPGAREQRLARHLRAVRPRIDAQGNLAITQSGITGLNCSYGGRYQVVDGRVSWQGSYNCTDGKRGDFQSTAIEAHALSLDIRLATQLTSSEACTIDAVLSMARFPP